MKFIGKFISMIKRLRFYEVLILVFIALFLGAWSVKEITESALFCGSTCHIMRPYYEDWKTSAHNKVPCVDCHLEPSEDQQFVPQFKAVRQVASYLTRTYGEHRRAEINDANCLKEGCHSKRLLDGWVTFADNIRFDHTPHLQQLRRGKILRCTTCHSRVAMGAHVTVVEDPCFICHFKDGGNQSPTSDCLLCHDTGENPAPAGTDFDHKPLRERGVPCVRCHQAVTRGNGQLKPESCMECHEQTMYEAPDEPVELLHRVHVTDHKVECSLCHDPITHSLPEETVAQPLKCDTCHEARHNGILDMYRGTGARGLSPQPSPMYSAHVGCTGCHIVPDPGGGMGTEFTGTNLVAVRAACLTCHPESYAGMIGRWEKDIADALKLAEVTYRSTERALSVKSYDDPKIPRIMDNIHHNILFVKSSTPIHNRDYALRILEKAVEDMRGITGNTTQR